MHNTLNPLASLMRQPKISIKLPSGGKYWEDGSLVFPVTSELEVYSMTARDELTLKTPDALLNGQAVVDVIQSCVPSIKNAWAVPSIDLDAILIAIRLATYGETMEASINLGDEEAKYDLNLRSLLDQLYTNISWEERIEISNSLIVYVKPLNYKSMSNAGVETFETQRLLNLVNDETIDEVQKLELFKSSFAKLTQITVGSVADSIYKIDTKDGSVTDTTFIQEYVSNCDREVFNIIDTHLRMLKDKNTIKPMRIAATPEMIEKGAAAEVEVPIIFDASTFFA